MKKSPPKNLPKVTMEQLAGVRLRKANIQRRSPKKKEMTALELLQEKMRKRRNVIGSVSPKSNSKSKSPSSAKSPKLKKRKMK